MSSASASNSAEILDNHLSYPASQPASPKSELKQVPPQPRQVLQDRLYIGNLHPSVDEYASNISHRCHAVAHRTSCAYQIRTSQSLLKVR
ncbi:hypothetical protein BDN71DRAFT_104579 [Pleurotus eryngii]|uniref:Uncharacterized protein n=1 Tax=Pleurotus eryngii TaxID=5323 RepID=A0A9P5ZN02_PLEER|nr:hypothetical protein BDN71DRAFT_104579 [Pleurotus eryngii]